MNKCANKVNFVYNCVTLESVNECVSSTAAGRTMAGAGGRSDGSTGADENLLRSEIKSTERLEWGKNEEELGRSMCHRRQLAI